MIHEIYLRRKLQTDNCTFGRMTATDTTVETLEDVFRETKIPGETRIPAGRYKLEFRREGKFHNDYSKLFPKMHKGMIHITGITDFDLVLIHIGNQKGNTRGCVLTGLTADHENDMILHSKKAYQKIYPVIAGLMLDDDTYINVIDEDR